MTEAKDWAGELISGQTRIGRGLVLAVFALSIASLVRFFPENMIDFFQVIYIYDASHHNFQVETCHSWRDSTSQQIDLLLNLFFLVYFFIRVSDLPKNCQLKFILQFIAASDKVWFLLDVYSFVDYFTIPPSFVAIHLQRNWLGIF